MKFDAEAKFGRKYRLQRVNYSLTARDSHTTRGSNVLVIANMITNTQKTNAIIKELPELTQPHQYIAVHYKHKDQYD